MQLYFFTLDYHKNIFMAATSLTSSNKNPSNCLPASAICYEVLGSLMLVVKKILTGVFFIAPYPLCEFKIGLRYKRENQLGCM